MGVPEQRGEASGDAQFFQARNDQQITQWITHVHTCGSHAEQIRADADGLVRQLTHVVGALQEERDALKAKVRRARTEGRSDALREVQSQLQDSELKLMSLRQRWEEAKQGREQAEQLLADARRAAEAYRREAEELRRRQGTRAPDEARPVALLQDAADVGRTADYDRVVTLADAQLNGLRDELHRLSADMQVRLEPDSGGWVVPGTVVPESSEETAHHASPGFTDEPPTPSAQNSTASSEVKARPLGVRVSLLATALSVALVLVTAESMHVMFQETHGPAVVWTVVYSAGALSVGFVVSYFVKLFVLGMGGWDGETEIGLKVGIHFFFFCLTLVYVLVDWPVGSYTEAVGRFLAANLGPL